MTEPTAQVPEADPPQYATTTVVPPPAYVGAPVPVAVEPQRGGQVVLVLASVVAGLLLLGAGFGLGRLTAPSGPTFVCGNGPQVDSRQGTGGGPLARGCRLRPGQGGGFGPGQGGGQRSSGGNGNGAASTT